MDTTTFRVLCPDGRVAEVITAEADLAEDAANRSAAHFDRIHDEARCDGLHRIERATWEHVSRAPWTYTAR